MVVLQVIIGIFRCIRPDHGLDPVHFVLAQLTVGGAENIHRHSSGVGHAHTSDAQICVVVVKVCTVRVLSQFFILRFQSRIIVLTDKQFSARLRTVLYQSLVGLLSLLENAGQNFFLFLPGIHEDVCAVISTHQFLVGIRIDLAQNVLLKTVLFHVHRNQPPVLCTTDGVFHCHTVFDVRNLDLVVKRRIIIAVQLGAAASLDLFISHLQL